MKQLSKWRSWGISAWDTARSLGEQKGVGGCYFQTVLPLTANFVVSCSFYCSCSKETTGVNITLGNFSDTHLWTPNTTKHRLENGQCWQMTLTQPPRLLGLHNQPLGNHCSSAIPGSWSAMATHKPQLPVCCSCPSSSWPSWQKGAKTRVINGQRKCKKN